MEIRNSQPKVVLYKGVPVTPAPTKQFNDKKQFDIQVKIEANMHLIISAVENDDKSKLLEALAWSRSGRRPTTTETTICGETIMEIGLPPR